MQREGFVFRAGSHGDAVVDGAVEDLCEAIVVVRFEGEIGSIQSANQQTCTFEVLPHPFAQGKHAKKNSTNSRTQFSERKSGLPLESDVLISHQHLSIR